MAYARVVSLRDGGFSMQARTLARVSSILAFPSQLTSLGVPVVDPFQKASVAAPVFGPSQMDSARAQSVIAHVPEVMS
jgi:hypothetical protein